MFKTLHFFLLITCFFIQACHHNAEGQQNLNVSKANPNKAANYNIQLGLEYLKQGDRPRAKSKLLTALDEAPKSPDVNAAIAYYYEQTSELDKAERYFLKAISLSSNSGAQLNNYGTFLCTKGDYKQAEQYFLKATKDPYYLHTSGAYENAGLCSLAMPNINKAKHYFQEALKQDPSRKVSLYELVKIEHKLGRNKEALKELEKYPGLVLNDPVFSNLAKKLANNIGDSTLAARYENNIRNMESNTDNSGVKNEYNNHNG